MSTHLCCITCIVAFVPILISRRTRAGLGRRTARKAARQAPESRDRQGGRRFRFGLGRVAVRLGLELRQFGGRGEVHDDARALPEEEHREGRRRRQGEEEGQGAQGEGEAAQDAAGGRGGRGGGVGDCQRRDGYSKCEFGFFRILLFPSRVCFVKNVFEKNSNSFFN